MRILLTGVAAAALLTTGAFAQGKGNGNGGGNGKGNAPAAQAKNNKPDRGPSRGNGNGNAKGKQDRADRGADRNDRGNRDVARGNGGNGNGRDKSKPAKAERGPSPAREVREIRTVRDVRDRYDDRRTTAVRYDDRRDRDYDDRRYRDDDRGGDRYRYLVRDRSRTIIDGCPPGLAKKRNGCNPPGQVKDRDRTIFGYEYRPRYFGLNSYRDDRYRYNDGYLVRYGDGNRISGWIPLLGGALATGNVWPQRYDSYQLPNYYVDYYDLGGPDRYRYADNVIYRVDAGDAAITSIAALLTGDEFVVGQRMPQGYDVYNVPYAYRDRYYDSPEAMYRYSDGQIYRMDPTTQLVQAVIGLLV